MSVTAQSDGAARLAAWGSLAATAAVLGVPPRQVSAWRRQRIPSEDYQRLIHEKLGIEPAAWLRQAGPAALARGVAAAAASGSVNEAHEAPGDPAADPVTGLRDQVRRLTKALQDTSLTQRSKNELEATLLRANAALAKCTSHALTEKEFRDSHFFTELMAECVAVLEGHWLAFCEFIDQLDPAEGESKVDECRRLYPAECAEAEAANARLRGAIDRRRLKAVA